MSLTFVSLAVLHRPGVKFTAIHITRDLKYNAGLYVNSHWFSDFHRWCCL